MLHSLFAAENTFLQDNWGYIALAVGIIVFLIFLIIFFSFVKLWIQSLLAGAKIGILDMIRMKLLNIDYSLVVRQKIAMIQAGVKVATQDLEAHVLARGRVARVVEAVISAHKAGLDLPWRVAAAIDLAGRDVVDAVKVISKSIH